MGRPKTPPPDIETVDWDTFLSRFRWKQGEHVSAIGPTGLGKSTFILELCHHRGTVGSANANWNAAVVATKPAGGDKTIQALARQPEWSLIRKWPPAWDERMVVFWPTWRSRKDDAAQAKAIQRMMDDAFSGRNRTVIIDELAYVCRKFGMGDQLKDWWQQGRSVGVSLVGLIQRPAWVPLDVYSQPEHLFFWRTQDEADLRRITGLGGMASAEVRAAVSTLDRYAVLYANTRTGQLLRTMANPRATR